MMEPPGEPTLWCCAIQLAEATAGQTLIEIISQTAQSTASGYYDLNHAPMAQAHCPETPTEEQCLTSWLAAGSGQLDKLSPFNNIQSCISSQALFLMGSIHTLVPFPRDMWSWCAGRLVPITSMTNYIFLSGRVLTSEGNMARGILGTDKLSAVGLQPAYVLEQGSPLISSDLYEMLHLSSISLL
ncbi:hypothetical protein BDW69DRAFT_163248, partial [Aspergillus filifer]